MRWTLQILVLTTLLLAGILPLSKALKISVRGAITFLMRSLFFKKFLRGTAFLTAVVFTMNTLAWGQVAALPAIQVPDPIFVPSPDPPALIHIQDAHANYTAQKDIAQILERLRTEQSVKLVFVEGATGRLDANYLKFTNDVKLNEKIAGKLAQMGELTAADLFLLKNATGLEFIGIENPDLYRRDVEALRVGARADHWLRLAGSGRAANGRTRRAFHRID